MCIIQLARAFERHWTECGGVCFLSKKQQRLIERITAQIIDYKNNR